MNWQFLFFSLQGRVSRQSFWIGVGAIFLFQLAVQTPLMHIWHIDPDKALPPVWFRNLSLGLDIICAWPLFAVLSKRQRDRNQGPHLSFCFLTLLLAFSVCEAFGLTQDGPEFTTAGKALGIPLLGVLAVVLIELGCRKGTPGVNDFGRDPLL
jgi:uncharacterized membrane protein YhaH (DUF805 family)